MVLVVEGRLIPYAFLITIFWAGDSTTVKFGTLRKGYGMSLHLKPDKPWKTLRCKVLSYIVTIVRYIWHSN